MANAKNSRRWQGAAGRGKAGVALSRGSLNAVRVGIQKSLGCQLGTSSRGNASKPNSVAHPGEYQVPERTESCRQDRSRALPRLHQEKAYQHDRQRGPHPAAETLPEQQHGPQHT